MPTPADGVRDADAVTQPRRAAVLGSPIAHSLSPVLHRAAYAALGLGAWRYDAHECAEAGLPEFVESLGPEWVGLSLTMPLKRVALDLAAAASPLATAVGAANTLVRRPDGWFADNTDVHGIVAALQEPLRPDLGTPPYRADDRNPARALILGAGGTAQAALAALRELGIDDITVAVRSSARADDLRVAAQRLGMAPVITEALAGAAPSLPPAEIVVSTLPAGAADGLGGQMRPGATVLDVVYAPWPTSFAAIAAARGAHIVSGLRMLLHQAVAQVELMTGHPGPVEEMRAALDGAVTARC